MTNLLLDYLKETATPEYLALTTEACELLDEIQYPDWLDAYTDVILGNQDSDQTKAIQQIDGTTRAFLTTVLAEHAIMVDEEISIPLLIKLTRGIFTIQDYEDYPAVHSTAVLESSPEEVFCELMTLVTSLEVEDMLPYVSSVNQFFITRVRENASEHLAVVTIKDASNREKYLTKLKQLTDFLGTKELATVSLLVGGWDVGFTFTAYADALGSNLDALPAEAIGKELVAVALISNDAIESPIVTIRQKLHEYVSDQSKYTPIDVEINRIILGMAKNEKV